MASKVRIVQLLCPERHCVMALAYLAKDGEADPEVGAHLLITFVQMVEKNELNPFCGLCKSKDIRAEDQPTVFATMDEARPHLREMERQQAETRKFWEASKG